MADLLSVGKSVGDEFSIKEPELPQGPEDILQRPEDIPRQMHSLGVDDFGIMPYDVGMLSGKIQIGCQGKSLGERENARGC